MKQRRSVKLNRNLTNWVINLHQDGYTDDFLAVDTKSIRCVQSGENFTICHLHIRLIGCGYDLLTRNYKYVHIIDTQVGNKGLLITNGILPLNN